MEQTENRQQPRQRKQEIKQRTGIENQGVPLGQKRKSAIIEWIPQRDFSPPEAFAMVMRQWIAKKSEVSIIECLQSEQDLRVGGKNGERQEKRKTSGRQPQVNQHSVVAGLMGLLRADGGGHGPYFVEASSAMAALMEIRITNGE